MVIGDSDVVSIETATELQEANPNIRVAQIPDAGHGVQYDQPGRFTSVVRSFLRTLGQPPLSG